MISYSDWLTDDDQEDLYYDTSDVLDGQNELDEVLKWSRNVKPMYSRTCVCLIVFVTIILTVSIMLCAGLYIIAFHKNLLLSLPSPQVENKTCSVNQIVPIDQCPELVFNNSMLVLNDNVYLVNSEEVSFAL